MTKAVLPVSPDIYEKILEIAGVSNESLRQTTDDLLNIALEEIWVGVVLKKGDGTQHGVIIMEGKREVF